MAARVAAHAGPGQVLVTDDAVWASHDPDVEFVDLGPVALKGLTQRVRLHETRAPGRPGGR